MRNLRQALVAIATAACAAAAVAQYGLPATLAAEAAPGDDLVFAKEAKELAAGARLSNAVFAPARKEGEKLPALIVFHTCGGVGEHIRDWTEAALQRGYVVLVPDGMRGLKHDCGSPPQIANARLIRDALDAAAHLAALPYVDANRISIVGFSKGALVATWLASGSVAKALRPQAPAIASAVAVYGFCALGPSRGRPEGVTILQPDTDRPLLMLMGGQDTETPPASCLERLPGLKAGGAPVQWHLYPEATHSWDAREKDGMSKTAFNGQRVQYRYDKAVTEDSRRRVFEFLATPGNGK
jgi:dienelactone hydrolase